ncbi:serine protease [Cylindrospermopsis raciborskii CS-506_D]|uniref:Serine protease n=1 Tax=Cylindrospermopsis raciborskii CS-506_A TaxID=2585140 RepID=A0A838WY70_9CYAN|nr:tetratricopeptide repeat-containing serine protease family protein [Cylindrospermopsis raciborskii]MBA4451151.1 serine protease [Cylindrospermopsis raciborskii CS-506_D]MBA4467129.1 serine protease [Cylindrospermopsis raciborskii CS-506_A]
MITLALTSEQVASIAEKFTVRISGAAPGSGVIINKNGNTYTVLTNFHIFDRGRTLRDGAYRVTTADGKTYPMINIVRIPDLDLARFNFRSNEEYRVVKIGSSDKIVRGKRIYVNGFPEQQEVNFLPGQVNRILAKPRRQGYVLVYRIGAFTGMSGSPILDEDGNLVGIHGLTEDVDVEGGGTTPEEYGIPINAYKSSSVYSNNAEFYFNRAYKLYESGDKQGAIVDYTQAIQINPNYADAYNNRGNARSELGDKQGAIVDYNQAIQINPNYAYAYNNRGNARSDLGDKQGAIVDYNQAIQINPNYAEAYHNRGLARYHLGDKQGAIVDYNQAIQINPNYANAYNNRGNARSELGDKQGAIVDYNQAIQINPNYAHAYYNRGNARSELGDKQGARGDFQTAARLYQQQGKQNDYQDALNRISQLR